MNGEIKYNENEKNLAHTTVQFSEKRCRRNDRRKGDREIRVTLIITGKGRTKIKFILDVAPGTQN